MVTTTKKLSRFQKLQIYYAKQGFRLEKTGHKVKGRIKNTYKLIVEKPLGASKKGETITTAATLSPFIRWQKTKFLERTVPKGTQAKIANRYGLRISPRTPRLR